MTNKAAGIGYHKSVNLAKVTPSRLMLVSRSDHVTLGGNQISSFQNHLVKPSLTSLTLTMMILAMITAAALVCVLSWQKFLDTTAVCAAAAKIQLYSSYSPQSAVV